LGTAGTADLRGCDGSTQIIRDNLSHPRKSVVPADSFSGAYSGLHLRVQADDDLAQYSSVFTSIYLCFRLLQTEHANANCCRLLKLQLELRKMKQLILGILLFFTFAFGARDAFAQCCCLYNVSKDIRGSDYSTAYEELKNSDAVFYGQIVEMKMIDRKPDREGANNYEVEIKFRVEKAWRRDLSEYITLREYSNGCGVGFVIASRWIVYADLDNDKNYRTGYCTRTRVAYRNIENDFKEFEANGEKQTKIIKTS
jgi:hypothetical protein